MSWDKYGSMLKNQLIIYIKLCVTIFEWTILIPSDWPWPKTVFPPILWDWCSEHINATHCIGKLFLSLILHVTSLDATLYSYVFRISLCGIFVTYLCYTHIIHFLKQSVYKVKEYRLHGLLYSITFTFLEAVRRHRSETYTCPASLHRWNNAAKGAGSPALPLFPVCH